MTVTSPTTTTAREPEIALPTMRLLAVSIGSATLTGGAWSLGALIAGASSSTVLAGLWGALIVSVAMSAGLLVMTPWKTRPVGLWMTLWLAGTLVRFIIAPLLAWVLYSAASVGPWSLVAAVGGVYFVSLLSEAIVLASFVKRALPA